MDTLIMDSTLPSSKDISKDIQGHIPRTYTAEHIVVVRYGLILVTGSISIYYLEAFFASPTYTITEGAIPNSDTQRLLGARVKGLTAAARRRRTFLGL